MSDAAMSDNATDQFERLQQLGVGQTAEALAHLADTFKEDGRYHELFDLRLLQARHRLGLPAVVNFSLDDLPEPLRSQVENEYLAACKEVGHLLLDAGRVGESWRYLRPVGDMAAVTAKVEAVEPDDDNLQQLIEVCLHEGVSPVHGFGLVLKHYGTCNAITTFDAEFHRRGPEHRQQAATLLIRHLHKELMNNVRYDIKRQEGSEPQEQSLRELIAERDWIFSNNNYHIDTTHLASVVRFARLVEDKEPIRLAHDLTEYGRRLSPQYHFPGEEPFTDSHQHHGLFFAAQLGEQVDEALAYFRERARSIDIDREGSAAAEVYIALLSRLGRHAEALEAAIELLPANHRGGFAPTLLELARAAGDYDRLLAVLKERGDLLGYAAALVEQSCDGARTPESN